ncbi:hypothetical protein D3C72_1280760 [compost metagenome]
MARHHRHGDADGQRGDGERAEHPADGRRRQADARTLDRDQERVQVPGGREHCAGDEHRAQFGMLEQVQRGAAAAVFHRDPAGVAARGRQARPHVLEPGLAEQRHRHQHAERGPEARVFDHIAHHHRAEGAGHRQPERVVGVVAQPRVGRGDLPDQQLHGHLDQHEANPDQRARRIERADVRPDRRQQRAGHHHQRARRHRQARADLVDAAPGADRQEHRQQRIERHQQAERDRGGLERNRKQGNDDATGVERHVVAHRQGDQPADRRNGGVRQRHGTGAGRGCCVDRAAGKVSVRVEKCAKKISAAVAAPHKGAVTGLEPAATTDACHSV